MNISDFNEQFFNKLENDCDDHEFYLNFVCKKFDIVNEQEIKAIIILFYWNYYVKKLFPNIIIQKKYKDPRKTSVFRYCYKLQKETNGIMCELEYKDYVYCQIKFLKMYVEKTNNPVSVTPGILNFDKGWKKYKYFKYLMKKSQHVIKSSVFVNNDLLKVFLQKDYNFLSSKIEITKSNLKINKENLLKWNRLGKISDYFIAFNLDLFDHTNKDYSVYNFDENGIKIYKNIFNLQ